MNGSTTGGPPADASWFRERLPEPEKLEEILGGDPAAALLRISRTRAPIEPGFEGNPDDIARDPEVQKQFDIATAAAKKLKDKVDPQLSPGEVQALHAFVHLVARPSLRVIDGHAPGVPEPWPDLVSDELMVAHRIRGIGRIARGNEAAGTGWLVGVNRLMTNKHVAAGLCGIRPDLDKNWRKTLEEKMPAYNKFWKKRPGTCPKWDSGDDSSKPGTAGRIQRIVSVHPDHDMALLELTDVADTGGMLLPLSPGGPSDPSMERVYVAGYPLVSNLLGLHPALLKLLFGGASSIVHKRVAPGLLRGFNDSTLEHDASTLGGNSGSAILDFETHRVVGLHFEGFYGVANHSVPLWMLKDDPFFTDAGIAFDS